MILAGSSIILRWEQDFWEGNPLHSKWYYKCSVCVLEGLSKPLDQLFCTSMNHWTGFTHLTSHLIPSLLPLLWGDLWQSGLWEGHIHGILLLEVTQMASELFKGNPEICSVRYVSKKHKLDIHLPYWQTQKYLGGQNYVKYFRKD